MLYKVGGFVTGSALGAGFVCSMDEIIYSQLRRNIILPFKQTFFGGKAASQVSIDDLAELGSGTANFAAQFKPHSLGKQNAKALLINDQEFSTP